MTVVIAITSDLHCGSTTGLCPESIQLDDGGEYRASKAQRWMWQGWKDYWKQVESIRIKEKAKLYTVFNGDLVDGNHHGTTQILSGNPNGQAAALNAAMTVPLALKPDKIWITRGTDAHVGQSACSEERIADGLRRDKRPVVGDPNTGTASQWHIRMEVEGTRLDFAHHGRVGTRPWTKPNVTANLAFEIFCDHAKDGIPHPHIAVRSHMHQLVDTGSIHPVRLIQTPCWQFGTSFIHRIAPGKLADIGGVIIVLRKGQAPDVRPIMYKPEPTPLWKAAA
jgi:hypothetical protein